MTRGNYRISGADIRWKEYRQQMTSYIQNEIQPGARILILGAGACDDLELNDLLEQASEIWLADINKEALEAAVAKVQNWNATYTQRLRVIETDFVSLTELQYEEYEEALKGGRHALGQWWQQYWSNNAGKQTMLGGIQVQMQQFALESFDLVISLGLHSQLYMELVLRTMRLQSQLPADSYKEAVARIQDANVRMAEQFMDAVNQVTNHLILGIEYTTIYKNQQWLQEAIIRQLTQFGSQGLQQMQLSRVEGAWQVEQELGKRYQKQEVELADSQYFLWPFSEEKSYLMVIFNVVCYNEKD